MTSGNDVYIGTVSSPASKPLVMVKVRNAGARLASGTGVVIAGSVRAPGGQVRVGGGDLFAAGFYNSGTIAGSDVTVDSGKGTNISAGKIDASSATGSGGRVEILGAKVAMTGTVDASGATGGGEVRIGGDFHGGGSLPTSETTVVTGAIHADATGGGGSGNGGTVVVWSDAHTVFTGTISAAGAGGGAGGAAEVSSHGVLDFNPVTVNMGGGQLLLDPISVTIQDANPDINGDGTTGDDINNKNDLNAVSDQSGKNSIITSGALNTVLSSDVTISASSFISINTSTVHINTGAKTLTLDAPDDQPGGCVYGDDCDGGTVATVNVTNTGAKIQDGVNMATAAGAVLNITAGTYSGAVAVTGNLTMNAVGTVVADSWTTSGAGKTVTTSGTFQSRGEYRGWGAARRWAGRRC